ncbi:MAG: oligosaccharide flippase family protein [Crocinitomicaceae bacterium]|nr:oligosaccharide flippase family protein [Crocinitomicaceae bacterium]
MNHKKGEYSEIAKATRIFGSSQIAILISNILRTKFVAIFLGASGYGILSLYQSSITLISTFSNLGIGTMAIKEIAAAHNSENQIRIDKTIHIVRKLSWYTGVAGAFLTLLFSVPLSVLIFGTRHFYLGFCWLSISILLNQLTTSNSAILRGLRKNKNLANAGVTGAVFGLLTSVPLYYFFGKDAIVPALIISSLISFIRSWVFTKNIEIDKNHIQNTSVWNFGKPLIAGGIVLSITTLVTIVKELIIRLYIEKNGGLTDVGLYHSALLIINSYLGIVFTIMSMDYFPNLSSKINDLKACKSILNKQIIFGLTIIIPLISFFLIFNGLIIELLLSNRFINIEYMISVAVLGTVFKLYSWSHSYIILSKGDNKWFFWSEFVAVMVSLMLSIGGYYFYGLNGLGYGYTLGFIYYAIQTQVLCSYWYKINVHKSTLMLFLAGILIVLFSHFSAYYINNIYFKIGSLLISIIFGLFLLKKMQISIDIRRFWKKK